MLDVEELLELEDNIRKELDDHLPAALSMLNRTGELETFLKCLAWKTCFKVSRFIRSIKPEKSL